MNTNSFKITGKETRSVAPIISALNPSLALVVVVLVLIIEVLLG